MFGPVYSEQGHCQDCYRCLRECPVKAIRVAAGHAVVMPDRCVACGTCVGVCPSGAKKVRDELALARHLIASGRHVVASLAPSFISEFPEATPPQLVMALKRLGFHGVSETALGAQEVSAQLAQDLDGSEGQVLLSTACPVAVDLVRKFLPEHTAHFMRQPSPLLTHAQMLRTVFDGTSNEDIGIVFFGPCIGKKLEAEAHPGLLDLALTFEDLRRWLQEESIRPEALAVDEEAVFIPGPASEGALYPVEGGMAEATRLNLRKDHTRFMTLCGVNQIQKGLLDLPKLTDQNLFLELLACEGGCVCGPKSSRRSSVAARMQVLDYARVQSGVFPRSPEISMHHRYAPIRLEASWVSEGRLGDALLRIGKRKPEDELNCGACGYDRCRDLAQAIVDGRAEDRMCVSNVRRIAEKKANALIRTLPFGVVIVGSELEIIECNPEFARLMGEDAMLSYQASSGLCGAHLETFLPFSQRFRDVLESGEEIIRENEIRNDRTLSVTVFTVEPHRVIGALLLDVTETERRRQQVIQKAELVIQNMLANVQDIAFSLGRNAAKSEGILNSIIAEFAPQDLREGGGHA